VGDGGRPVIEDFGPFAGAKGGIRARVRLQPGASANKVDGIASSAAGIAVKVRVTTVPEGGKANAALLKLLSSAWRVPSGTLTISSGAKDRNKMVMISGDQDILLHKLKEWSGSL